MAHLVQVGAGSGGMAVLDMVCRDCRITRVSLIDPDIYKPHNIERHLFPATDVGRRKAELAKVWLEARRTDLEVNLLCEDLTEPAAQDAINEIVAAADIGICAADNEHAKYHWDRLMRGHGRPWTLGEVLSGGIGGFVHWFSPNGPCYGCVASHLKRNATVEPVVRPDYSTPGGPVEETAIPASKAAIHAIASLHAVITLDLLASSGAYAPGFTTLLLTLREIPDVFEEAFRSYRFRVNRSADCLICREGPAPASSEELDVALDQALARLGHA